MAMITNDWLDSVSAEFKKPYYRDLYDFVKKEYSTHVVYPPADDIFNALHLTPLSEVKVLILGQDPYHNEHQAHVLSYCRIRKRFHHLYRTSIKNCRMTLAAISLTMVIWKNGQSRVYYY